MASLKHQKAEIRKRPVTRTVESSTQERERGLHLALATCTGVLLAIKDEVRWTTRQRKGIEDALVMAEKAMGGSVRVVACDICRDPNCEQPNGKH